MKHKPTPDSHRPIVVASVRDCITEAEIAEIRAVATKIVTIAKKLEPLVERYRELVGYELTKLDYAEQAQDVLYHGLVESWVKHARDAREEWTRDAMAVNSPA